jgi:hypothetical protein
LIGLSRGHTIQNDDAEQATFTEDPMIRPSRSVCALLVVAGCTPNPLDVLGVEEQVIETEAYRKDDQLSDKHPEYDPGLTVVETFGHCKFTLNKSASVTRLTVQKLGESDRALDGVLFPTRAAALAALGERTVVASMEVVNGALKPFNDGLYAAIELLIEAGTHGSLVNKRAVWDALLGELLARHQVNPAQPGLFQAAADLGAAAELGGSWPSEPPVEIRSAALERLAKFNQDAFHAQPVGFYTWVPELDPIFRRDRWLMYSEPPPEAVGAVAGILAERPELESGYAGLLGLYAGLTNPPITYSALDLLSASGGSSSSADAAAMTNAFRVAHPDYGTACGKGLSWFPPSTSAESELFRRVACTGGTGANLLDLLIQAIQSGAIDLTPRADSGWYDRQLYALETLLLPERAGENDHLLLTREYKEKLVETFKSLIIQTRETHAKQLGMGEVQSVDPTPIDLYPLLPVEPFPTFYLRTARAYAFLGNFLRTTLGTEALNAAPRLFEEGTRAERSIASELDEKIRLLYGLHRVAAASIGMRPEISPEEQASVDITAAEAEARGWLGSWPRDADVLRDPRVILPIMRDQIPGTTTYWAIAGIKALRIHASYPAGYEPQVVSSSFCSVNAFVPFEPYLLVEQALQVTRPSDLPPLTRDEFRAIADANPTLEGLRRALESG